MAENAAGTRAVVASLVVGVFFGGVVGGVAFPTLPRLGAILGFSAVVVGVILAVNRATRVVVSTPAGAVLDRIGTRRPMLAGFLLEAVAPLGYLLGMTPAWNVAIAGALPVSATTASAATFVAARVLWGVGSAFVIVGAFSTVTRITTPANRGRWTGYMRGSQTLGFPAGLVVGGLTADLLGFRAAFVVALGAALVAFAVSALVLPDLTPDGARDHAGLRDLPRLAFSDVRVLAVGTTNFVVRLLYAGILLTTVVEYAAANDIHVGFLSATGVSGVLMAVSTVFASVTTLTAGRLSDRVTDRTWVTVPAFGCLTVGFASLALVPTLAGALVGVASVGIGVEGVSIPLMAYLGDISPSDDVGKLGGVYTVFGDLGSTVGPLVALPFAVRYGYRVEYLACVAFVVVTALLVVALVGDDGVVRAASVPADD